MKHFKTLPQLLAVALFFHCASLSAQNFTVLHAFGASAGTTNPDGAEPSADLLLAGGILYGTAHAGGSNGLGTVFSIDTAGTFTVLYSFTGGSDGSLPQKHLVLSGDTLYGTAGPGTNGGFGSIFSIITNGMGFATVYTFTNASNGKGPGPGLLVSGTTLYGTANEGGNNNGGTVFSVNTDGTGFNLLHTFIGSSDGQNPNGGLILSADSLYSTARNSGPNGFGTIFSLTTNGMVFNVLHAFSGQTNQDGALPEGNSVISGNTIYGTTFSGGTNRHGTVFSINTNGGYNVIYSFSGGADGSSLEAGVALAGGTLYGTAIAGGTNSNSGTVYSLNTDGSSFTVLHTFSTFTGSIGDTNRDGARPFGDVTVSGNMLYGTAQLAGVNGVGTVYSLAIVPSLTGINLAGSNVILHGINGLSGHTCTVLTSTDAALPLNLWTPVATNVLAGGGNFTITASNAVNPVASRQFYSLQSQ